MAGTHASRAARRSGSPRPSARPPANACRARRATLPLRRWRCLARWRACWGSTLSRRSWRSWHSSGCKAIKTNNTNLQSYSRVYCRELAGLQEGRRHGGCSAGAAAAGRQGHIASCLCPAHSLCVPTAQMICTPTLCANCSYVLPTHPPRAARAARAAGMPTPRRTTACGAR